MVEFSWRTLNYPITDADALAFVVALAAAVVLIGFHLIMPEVAHLVPPALSGSP